MCLSSILSISQSLLELLVKALNLLLQFLLSLLRNSRTNLRSRRCICLKKLLLEIFNLKNILCSLGLEVFHIILFVSK